MPQLHFYVSEETEKKIKLLAESEKASVSKYVAKIVNEYLASGWEENYFTNVIGKWHGEPLQRPAQGDFEHRQDF